MNDRPEEFRYDAGIGRIVAVYPNTWEVDIEAEDGGLIQRALVEGPKRPKPSRTERPEWVEYGFASHLQGRPVCRLLQSRLMGSRFARSGLVYFEEIETDDGRGFRITVDQSGNLEIRSLTEPLRQIRILDQDGVVRVDTPSTRIVLKEGDKSAELHCDGDASVDAGGDLDATAGGTAKVTAGGDATVESTGGNVTVKATATVTLQGAAIALKGPVTITGDVAVTGKIAATTTIMDVSGNSNHHSHG
jgi:hypothetical protein